MEAWRSKAWNYNKSCARRKSPSSSEAAFRTAAHAKKSAGRPGSLSGVSEYGGSPDRVLGAQRGHRQGRELHGVIRVMRSWQHRGSARPEKIITSPAHVVKVHPAARRRSARQRTPRSPLAGKNPYRGYQSTGEVWSAFWARREATDKGRSCTG